MKEFISSKLFKLIKESLLSRRKMTPDKNMSPCKGMKNTRRVKIEKVIEKIFYLII